MVYSLACALVMMFQLLAAARYARSNQIGYTVMYCTLAIIMCMSVTR